MLPNDHIVNHIHHHQLAGDNTLHVIGVITNPMRYHSRLRLFREWYKAMEATPNVKVYVVEAAFGDRQHEVTEAGNPCHLQLRIYQEIWHKENLINLAVKRLLPHNWKYMCWSDCDVFQAHDSWALESIHQMQHYSVIQPWSDCIDLGFHGNILHHFQSFCYIHRLGVPKQCHPSQPYKYAHSGFMWACRRDFWEAVGGLLDWSILGSADHHCAFGLIGEIKNSIHDRMGENFKRLAKEWEHRAYRFTKGHLGFVKGRIEHRFHGKKASRKYRERWALLIENSFDPVNDLTYDPQGVITLTGKPKLLQSCREYMVGRNEDEISDY